MASDKQKRFRVHVVKEMHETEKDYTSALEFTVTYILEKAKELHHYDNTFTEHHIKTLFCNIEQILEFHKKLVVELGACLGSKGPAYDTLIAQCYLKHRENFDLYRVYGENNEHAQKLLYELEEKESMKAFFIACMLLGGKGDDDISSYLFKPIQRVCKYPLLFRELIKYTPTSHPDYAATEQALDMMRDVCSVINEARRRVEKLEAIADWQATVENWEGSNVTDTCNELVKEGPLIKISAGNTQERQFYLFDNLFVYCKKSTILGGRAKPLFRGRIAVESLSIEDIEDGSCDYYTNGIHVTNSWKVHNISKNKWFVLIAKNHEEKQFWMDAMRRVKENRKREQAGRASNTRHVILKKGEKIYDLITKDHVPKDHKVRLKTYPKSFSGKEFTKWMMVRGEVEKVEQAIILGQALLENGVIHHVNDRHQFKNNEYLYRFRYDDNSFRGKLESDDLSARGVRIYCRLHSLFDPLIKEHRVGLRSIPGVVVSQKLIDWWYSEKDISRRVDGITLGEQFFATGVLRHITDEQNFKDGQILYRFTADDSHEAKEVEKSRRFTQTTKTEFLFLEAQNCRTVTFVYDEKTGDYGVGLTDGYPVSIKSLSSKAQTLGVSVGDIVHAVNGQYITSSNTNDPLSELSPSSPVGSSSSSHATPLPLHLLVAKTSSQYCTLFPTKTGLGFHIKGSIPVVISDIDQDSAASKAGITIGSCLLKVGDVATVKMRHDDVVKEVRKALDATAKSEGGKRVELKLSRPLMEHMAMFQYENVQGAPMEVFERNVESPYTFSLPAQLLKLYGDELLQMARLVSSAEITDFRVNKYLDEIKAIAALYLRTNTTLCQPKWPTYKLNGIEQHSKFVEACPTNLHTSVMGVVRGLEFAPGTPSKGGSVLEQSIAERPDRVSISERSISERSMSDFDEDLLPSASHTSYAISTMQIPTAENCSLMKEDKKCLEDVQSRREMLHNLVNKVREMIHDQDSMKKMIPELRHASSKERGGGIPNGTNGDSPSHHSSPHGLGLPESLQDDLTPVGSPTNSPVQNRKRLNSVSNPEPVIKIIAEALVRKGEAMAEMLDDRLLISTLEDADGIVKPNHKDVLSRFRERLEVLSAELRSCAKRPGPALLKAVEIFIETVRRHVEELCVHLWVSLILCDKSCLMESVDKLFSQILTGVVTGFSQQLTLALRGELNPGVEYGDSNYNSSRQWLQLVGKKGVLVHFEGTMLPKEESELSDLLGLELVLSQMERVMIDFQLAGDTSPPPLPGSELYPVTLEGGHDGLRVLFHLPHAAYSRLPEEAISGNGIKIHTVLFNKGLLDLEEGHASYATEKSLNTKGLKSLEAYYKHIRAFRLDKSNLPDDSDEKTLAINKISIPLNAMEFLMRQLRIAVQEPTRPGVGLLTLAAELTTRMGAVRVNFCDSGVYRSGLSASLEHVMVLGRCHGLHFKNFRSAVNCMRRHGKFTEVIRKNQADLKKALPKQPLKLFQLPAEHPQENRAASPLPAISPVQP